MIDLTDKVLNILVFVFIGLMIWLYFEEVPQEDRFYEDDDL